MGFSLSIHIVLAVIGMVLPIMILIAEYLGMKYGDRDYTVLAKRLATALLIFFAIGTASGMLVAINLFFLWPTFAALVGKVAILTVYIEVFAFFSESIFLALYLYSGGVFKNKNTRLLLMGIVAVGAAASAGLITVLNAFMNTPTGFNIPVFLSTGAVQNINPLAVFSSASAAVEVSHVLATSYFAGSAMFLAYFAYRFLKTKDEKERRYYEKAVKLTFCLVLVGAALSVYTGIRSIENLYYVQPEKFAAIELDLNPISHAAEIIGGIYANGAVKYGLEIPNLQSILATGGANGTVPGLSQYPVNTWPPLMVHDMFDLMFFAGIAIGVFVLIILMLYLKNREIFRNTVVNKLFIATGALALILLENGWMVDEIGRQPWIIYNVMTVQQAANTSPSIIPIAVAIVALYIIILPLTFVILHRIFSKRKLSAELSR